MLLHVPEQFQTLAPEDYMPGGVSDRLISFVDLAPTAISLAGGEIPDNMQGVAFAGPKTGPAKDYLFGFRGRMDERIDMVRSCTDGRYVYMRHFYPERPYLKHVSYMFETPTTQVWKRMFDAGELNEVQAKFWGPKPVEELFDLQSDPDETINLANNADQAERVTAMRTALVNHMVSTGDLGLVPEAEMHRLSADAAPRTWALENVNFEMLTFLAFKAMDTEAASVDELVGLAKSDDSTVRWWAVRGLAIRPSGDTRDSALVTALKDDSPSVAVAAADGLLSVKSRRDAAVERLTELADASKHGHFVAVAALNALDMNAALTDSERAMVAKLPRKTDNAPVRADGYVGRLLDDIQ